MPVCHYIGVNKCLSGTHNCEQVCTDTALSFVCLCYIGYVLNSDRRTCRKFYLCLTVLSFINVFLQCSCFGTTYTKIGTI